MPFGESSSTTEVKRDPIEQSIARMRWMQELLYNPLRRASLGPLAGMLFGTNFDYNQFFSPKELKRFGKLGGQLNPRQEAMLERLQGIGTEDLKKGQSRKLEKLTTQKGQALDLEDIFGPEQLQLGGTYNPFAASFERFLSSVAGPQIEARNIAQGMGRGGATGEQLASTSAAMALPLQQMYMQSLMGLADPNQIFFQPARTTTTTQGSNPWDTIMGIGSLALSPFTGGTSLAGLGNRLLSSFWYPPNPIGPRPQVG